MAVFIVSNTGGNINAGATYVGGVAPTSGVDSIAYTALSGQLTINVAFTVVNHDLSLFTNTITFNDSLSVSGVLNYGTGGYTQAGAFGIIKTVGGSITSNGTVWTRRFTTAASINITNNDVLRLSGLFTWAGNCNFNGADVHVQGDLSITGNTGSSGTSLIVVNGVGLQTWSGTSKIRHNFTINKPSSNFTISGAVSFSNRTFTYIPNGGNVITVGSTLSFQANTTFDTNSMNWYNVNAQSSIITLNSDFNVTNNLTIGAVGSVTFQGNGSFTCANLSFTASGRTLTLKNALTYTITTSLTLANVTVQSSNASYSFFNLQVGATQTVSNTNATWINSSGGQSIFPTGTYTLSNTINWGSGGNMFLTM